MCVKCHNDWDLYKGAMSSHGFINPMKRTCMIIFAFQSTEFYAPGYRGREGLVKTAKQKVGYWRFQISTVPMGQRQKAEGQTGKHW